MQENSSSTKPRVRVAIIGSRGFNDPRLVASTMNSVLEKYEVTEVVSGGAHGADTLGEQWAKAHGIPTRVFLADWNRFGKSAGIRRNHDIIAGCDLCVAFWDGASRGTAHSLGLARDAGKRILVVRYNA